MTAKREDSTYADDAVNRLRVALGKTVRSLDRRTNQDGITRTQMTVLATIARRESIPLSELAEYEGINPTLLSRTVSKLEELGLVRRVLDENDRRVAHAEIMAAGTKLWEHHRQVRTELLAELLDALPPREVKALLAAVPALEALAEVARQPPRR